MNAYEFEGGKSIPWEVVTFCIVAILTAFVMGYYIEPIAMESYSHHRSLKVCVEGSPECSWLKLWELIVFPFAGLLCTVVLIIFSIAVRIKDTRLFRSPWTQFYILIFLIVMIGQYAAYSGA